ncbi:MAG: PTS sugar transporter subunit IIA [Spirochaetales bacterium]|uniref:Ascorbate-specific PTS system EIIA component n=1 Tax=Candidatus Thalassospirochaeta sargassi TaxID=3119039 RepID=A0AAJ1MHB4_9SPIO|nr:PTS sugar transporter subunit IIA [Spirochaetales bacterium]
MGFTEYIVEKKAVICGLEVDTWEDAILKGGRILVDNGAASEDYLATIIRKCKDNGPYIVIAPGIAMPHARPEEGALSLGYGIVTLKMPVSFKDPDNDPISLLIFMAAPSVKEHNEEAVSQIADLCDDEDAVEAMIKASDVSEILTILENVEGE